MGRMKDLDTRLNEVMELINFGVDETKHLRESSDEVNRRLDGILHLLADMVKMEDQIRTMEKNIELRLSRIEASQMDSSKLVDRLIEMSLVHSGNPDQAILHRAQSRLDKTGFEAVDPPDDEDVWPPPGCDAMESIG